MRINPDKSIRDVSFNLQDESPIPFIQVQPATPIEESMRFVSHPNNLLKHLTVPTPNWVQRIEEKKSEKQHKKLLLSTTSNMILMRNVTQGIASQNKPLMNSVSSDMLSMHKVTNAVSEVFSDGYGNLKEDGAKPSCGLIRPRHTISKRKLPEISQEQWFAISLRNSLQQTPLLDGAVYSNSDNDNSLEPLSKKKCVL